MMSRILIRSGLLARTSIDQQLRHVCALRNYLYSSTPRLRTNEPSYLPIQRRFGSTSPLSSYHMTTSSADRTQLPVLPLLLSAALVLLSAAAPICQAQPVLDANGDPVRSNNVYRLRFEAIGFFGGVTVFPNANDTACARQIGLGEESDPGLPVWILPGGTVTVGDSILRVSARSKIRIIHDFPANCADPWVWTVPGNQTAQFRPVVAGMEKGNPLLTNEWFEVRETDKARVYKLIYCRACLLCEIFCTAEVGLDQGRLGVGGQPFPVRFVKWAGVDVAK